MSTYSPKLHSEKLLFADTTGTRRAHVDKAYTPYAFTFNVHREILEHEPVPSAPYGLRSASMHRNLPPPSPIQCGPPGGGASFVDVTLGVVVRQTAGTVMAIRPEFTHGTSKGYGAQNSGITIAFSQRVRDAWKQAMEGKIEVQSFQGSDTGDDN